MNLLLKKKRFNKGIYYFNYFIDSDLIFDANEISFNFLNREKIFGKTSLIDFGFNNYGELWSYNLNYFEFLTQENVPHEVKHKIFEHWRLKNYSYKHITWDPYPVSLRLINLIKWVSKDRVCFSKNEICIVNNQIEKHLNYLRKNLEYHLMGNHLLENIISIIIASIYFNNNILLSRYFKKLLKELSEQINDDGFHFELSIMYHNIILERLLDLNGLIIYSKLNAFYINMLLPFINKMLFVSTNFIVNNTSYPAFNDVIRESSNRFSKLLNYAKNQGINITNIAKKKLTYFKKSGYLVYIKDDFQFFFDFGPLGPKFIPGHGHNDCLSFELYLKGKPIIVNTGTSDYNYSGIRINERNPNAHNTISIGEIKQSETWSRFRAGRQHVVWFKQSRNKTSIILDASMSNYNNLYKHKRRISLSMKGFLIEDWVYLNKKIRNKQIFFNLHFAPYVNIIQVTENKFVSEDVDIVFDYFQDIIIDSYNYARGVNSRETAIKLVAKPNSENYLRTEFVFKSI